MVPRGVIIEGVDCTLKNIETIKYTRSDKKIA